VKIIFLDIDGVLNSVQSVEMARRVESGRKGGIDVHDQCFCPIAISNLNCAVEDVSNLWIVISSTWRKLHTLPEIRQMLSMDGFLYPWRIFSSTPIKMSSWHRGSEILWWLQENAQKYEVNSFAILDDADDMEPHMEHLVLTDHRHGFMYKDLEKLIDGFKSGKFKYKVA